MIIRILISAAFFVVVGCASPLNMESSVSAQQEVVFVGTRDTNVLHAFHFSDRPFSPQQLRELGFDKVRGAVSDTTEISNACGFEEAVYRPKEILFGPVLNAYSVFNRIGEWCESETSPSRVLVYASYDGSKWRQERLYYIDVDANGNQFLVSRIYQDMRGLALEKLRRPLPTPYFYARLEDEPPGLVQFGIEDGTYLVSDGKIYLVSAVYLSDLRKHLK